MRLAVFLFLAVLGAGSAAHAQNVLSVADAAVDAGEFDLVLSIELAVDQDLTRLRFDLTFDQAFCNALQDPEAIELDSADRTIGDPNDEIPIFCDEGQIRVDVRDEFGDVVIEAGSGPVIEVDMGTVRADAAGTFVFGLTNVLARAGGADVAVAVAPGTLTIRPVSGGTTSTTTTSPPGSTVTTTTSAPGGTSTTATVTVTSTTGPAISTTTTIVTGSTTTTSLPSGLCPDDPTLAAIGCRMDALSSAAAATTLPARLDGMMARGHNLFGEAEVLCDAGDTFLARSRLRSTIRTLIGFRHRLGSLTTKRRVPASVREPLRDGARAVLVDLRPLKRTLVCPVGSPNGAFIGG